MSGGGGSAKKAVGCWFANGHDCPCTESECTLPNSPATHSSGEVVEATWCSGSGASYGRDTRKDRSLDSALQTRRSLGKALTTNQSCAGANVCVQRLPTNKV